MVNLRYAAVVFACLLVSFAAAQERNFSSVYNAYTTASESNDYQLTVNLALEAYDLGKVKFGELHENTLALEFNVANAYVANEQSKEAIKKYKVLQDKYEDAFGEASPEYFNLGLTYLDAVNNTKSLKHEKKVKLIGDILKPLVSNIEALGEAHPHNAAIYYHALSMAFLESSPLPIRLRRLESIVEEAEKLAHDTWGESDLRTVEVHFARGILLKSTKQKELAAQQFELVVDVFNKHLDFSHPWELASHARLVEIYEELDDSESATEHCVAIGSMTPWQDNIDPVPLFRVHPTYPLSAAKSGREGWVKIQFDITEQGFVANATVLETSKGGAVFKKTSLAALEQWRYAPKFEDGQAQVAASRFVQLDYKLAR